jgi:hypothetical protein
MVRNLPFAKMPRILHSPRANFHTRFVKTMRCSAQLIRSATVNRKIVKFAAAASTVALMVSGCGGNTSTRASTVTVTQSQPAFSTPAWSTSVPPSNTYTSPATTTAAAVITIPDLIGQNAKIAEDQLKALGFTNVELASATPKYQNVFVPANWTVIGIEPAPGTAVNASDDVVVKVTKP